MDRHPAGFSEQWVSLNIVVFRQVLIWGGKQIRWGPLNKRRDVLIILSLLLFVMSRISTKQRLVLGDGENCENCCWHFRQHHRNYLTMRLCDHAQAGTSSESFPHDKHPSSFAWLLFIVYHSYYVCTKCTQIAGLNQAKRESSNLLQNKQTPQMSSHTPWSWNNIKECYCGHWRHGVSDAGG